VGLQTEFDYSQGWGHWVLDGYAAVWFFTTNAEFFSHNSCCPGIQTQTEEPIRAFEGHLSYDVKPHLWISLDGISGMEGRPASTGWKIN
jgi:hypothetical protein